MNNQLDTVSYSLGLDIALNMHKQGFKELNVEAFAQAMKDVYQNGSQKFTQQEAQKNIQTYFEALKRKQFQKNVEAGDAFLAKNKKKKGVISLPSGLQYEILKTGTGAKPKLTDKVKTHYHGTLIDGRVFDSSVERGEPISFPVNGVIKGWTEALMLMPVGSKWRLVVPSNLAYGENAPGGIIEPYSVLVFEVELLGIE